MKFPGQRVVNFRFGIFQGQIFQFAFDGIQTQPVSKRRIQIQCFGGDILLFPGRHGIEGAHVMKPVGQFYQDNPYIVGKRQEHFFKIFGLKRRFHGLVPVFDLGKPVDNVCYPDPEFILDKFDGIIFVVFNHIVEQGTYNGCFTQPDFAGDNPRNFYRMIDIRFSAQPPHGAMGFACHLKSFLHPVFIAYSLVGIPGPE